MTGGGPDPRAVAESLTSEVPIDPDWRVLSSGALAYRQPPSKHGRAVWLDAVLGVRLCEHGQSATQIHHWRCKARPREKPGWVACTCEDANGLCMDTIAPPAELPSSVPPYHEVLWRDAQPTTLDNGVRAVKVPGKPKGAEVYLDAEGRTRCQHGLTYAQLRERRARQRASAATRLQTWWRALDAAERSAVRAELRRHQREPPLAAPFAEPFAEPTALQRAADVWRDLPRRATPPTSSCACATRGMRLERFGYRTDHSASSSRKRHQQTKRRHVPGDALEHRDDSANRRRAV
jgi:hypothetical protein